MALLTTIEIYQRLSDIEVRLADRFVSYAATKRLLQEQAELIAELRKRGYEP